MSPRVIKFQIERLTYDNDSNAAKAHAFGIEAYNLCVPRFLTAHGNMDGDRTNFGGGHLCMGEQANWLREYGYHKYCVIEEEARTGLHFDNASKVCPTQLGYGESCLEAAHASPWLFQIPWTVYVCMPTRLIQVPGYPLQRASKETWLNRLGQILQQPSLPDTNSL